MYKHAQGLMMTCKIHHEVNLKTLFKPHENEKEKRKIISAIRKLNSIHCHPGVKVRFSHQIPKDNTPSVPLIVKLRSTMVLSIWYASNISLPLLSEGCDFTTRQYPIFALLHKGGRQKAIYGTIKYPLTVYQSVHRCGFYSCSDTHVQRGRTFT